MTRHKRLDDILAAHQRPLRSALRLIVILLVPFLAFGVFDIVGRFLDQTEHRLPPPWVRWPSPYPPNVRQVDENGWGDLLRMSGIPAYEKEFSSTDRRKVIESDDEGFRNISSDEPPEVIVTGASFFDAGSTNLDTFASKLASYSGLAVRNRSLPGQGPVAAVLRAVEQNEISEPSRIVIYGVVQRALRSDLFRPVFRELDADGTKTDRGARRLVAELLPWLRWNGKLENYLEATSPARKLTTSWSPFLPPMSLDEGLSSPVSLWELQSGGERLPILFLDEELQSYSREATEDEVGAFVAAFDRVASAVRRRGGLLLVVLVPDKFQFYAKEVEPSGRVRVPASGGRLPAALAAALNQRGIAALDLYEPLRQAQIKDPGTLLFRRDDTHWSDAGIDIAARHVAEYLRAWPTAGELSD